MTRAIGFYKQLFGKDPEHIEDRYSFFKLGDFFFGLYCPTVDGETMKIGNNCVPSFKVKDINKEYKRIRKFAPAIDDEIHEYGSVRLFQFKDSEGNILEVYSEN